MKAIRALVCGSLALALAGIAGAQTSEDAEEITRAEVLATQADSIRRVVVYGNDPCPRGIGDEIVVCARKPDSERYRIPENLRTSDLGPSNESWAARAQMLEYVGDTGIQSCSTVGPGGFTGCFDQIMQRWRADRQDRPAAAPPPVN